MRARPLRRLLLGLLALLIGVGGQPLLRQAPAARAAETIRWGYYVTYSADSLASLKANIASLTHVSPHYYSLKTDGTIDTRAEQPTTTAFLRDSGVKVLPMISTSAQHGVFHALLDTEEERDRLVAAIVGLVTGKDMMGSRSTSRGWIRPIARSSPISCAACTNASRRWGS